MDDWSKKTDMGVEPNADGWSYGGTDIYSVAGGILTINSQTPGGTTTGNMQISPSLSKATGWTVQWSMQVVDVDGTGNTLIFQIQDTRSYCNIKFFNGEINWEQLGDPGGDITMDTTDTYHVYKLERQAGSDDIKFYVDDVLKKTYTDGSTTPLTSNFLQQDADATSGNNCTAYVDYIYYKNDGVHVGSVDITVTSSVQAFTISQPTPTARISKSVSVDVQTINCISPVPTTPIVITYTDKYSTQNNVYRDKY